jgi:hypothetical protein
VRFVVIWLGAEAIKLMNRIMDEMEQILAKKK